MRYLYLRLYRNNTITPRLAKHTDIVLPTNNKLRLRGAVVTGSKQSILSTKCIAVYVPETHPLFNMYHFDRIVKGATPIPVVYDIRTQYDRYSYSLYDELDKQL